MGEEEKTALKVELRDLIVRRFVMRHHLSICEVTELLNSIIQNNFRM